MRHLMTLVLVVGLFTSILLTAPATVCAGDMGVKIGTLIFEAVPGTRSNLIITSSVDVIATFEDESGGKEYYIGEMGVKLGVDFSYKSGEVLQYGVFSPAKNYKAGSYGLQGKYFGQKASVAVGAGPAVQILLGGGGDSFTLQPLSVGYTTGFGASAGLGYLYLQKDPSK